jgi:stage III sporulation protein AB
MITVVGATLVLAGCACFGILAVKALNERTKALWRLISALDYMAAEIKHGLTPLPEIFNELFGGNNVITSDVSLGDRWKSVVAPLKLNEKERQTLYELGSFLGKFGQETAIERTREQFHSAFDRAKDEQRAKSKLYGFMGAGLGILIVILAV